MTWQEPALRRGRAAAGLTCGHFRSGPALITAAAPRAGLEPICRPLRIPVPCWAR